MILIFLVFVAALCLVGVLVYIHFRLPAFPANARQLSDLWAMVEGKAREDFLRQ